MKDENRAAIKKMKPCKATGSDCISVELSKTLEDYGMAKVAPLLIEIYNTGQIPPDISKSLFIALPKKSGTTDCELHRTISLITQILLRTIVI